MEDQLIDVDLAEYKLDPHAATYAADYDRVLGLFQRVATSPRHFYFKNVPNSYCPFLLYISEGSVIEDSIDVYEEDALVAWPGATAGQRRVVEIASAARPELAHALYLADTAWQVGHSCKAPHQSIPMTCNGSFHRAEVQHFRHKLREYVKPYHKRVAVIVPCSAQKPYPAPHHAAVIHALLQRKPAMTPDNEWNMATAETHLLVVSGTLGLCPYEMWDEAPNYDAGLPNQARVIKTAEWFFAKNRYDHVIVFADFYAWALHKGMPRDVADSADFVFGTHYRDTYSNLCLDEHLGALEVALTRTERT